MVAVPGSTPPPPPRMLLQALPILLLNDSLLQCDCDLKKGSHSVPDTSNNLVPWDSV